MKTEKEAKVVKANYRLQQKVGFGPVDEVMVKNSQKVIDTNKVDFLPLGLVILTKLQDGLEKAKDPTVTMQQLKAGLTAPVMELKANAAIFRYTLIGNMANIMLHFLETIRIMDQDAIDIVQAHHNSLHMILMRGLSGDGGLAGKQLIQELQQACDRYYHKKFNK